MRIDGAIKWYAAAAMASVLVLLAGWFLLVSPQRQSAEDIGAQAEAQVAGNAVTQTKIDALKVQYANLPTLQKQLAVVQTHMPETANLPGLLRNLSAAATAAGVKLISVTPAAPSPLGTAAQSGKASDSGLSAPGGVQVIGVTLTVSGPFANTRLFLTTLEAMPRSFLVTGLAIARDTAGQSGSSSGTTTTKPGNTLTTTITGRVFKANPGLATAAVASTSGDSSSSTVKNS
jgi:type IV pilus assembly protein PilO